MTDKNPLAHYSGVLSEAVQEIAAEPDQAQIKALMRKHRIWIEHSTLFEDDEPPRELRAVQAEQHQFEAFVKDLVALGTAPAAQVADFQQRVQPWMMACFGPEISADRIERNHRFLEESLELVQSLGCTASEAHQLVDYVFGRPAGEPVQEAGGVMVTLAALSLASGLDMHACGETELARIWTKVEAIRAKQAAKPKHSPLPMHTPQARDVDGIYYLQDARWSAMVENCPSFWRLGGGYTTSLDDAERFTLEAAMKQHKCRETDLPWLCSELDKLRRPTIDCQYMPRSWDDQRAAIAAQAAQQGDDKQ